MVNSVVPSGGIAPPVAPTPVSTPQSSAPRVPSLQEYLDEKSREFEEKNASLRQSNPSKWNYKYGKMLDAERRNYIRKYQGGRDVDYVKINQQEREAEERRAFYEKYPELQAGVQTDQRTGRAVLVQQGKAPQNNEQRLNALRGGAFNYQAPSAAYLRQDADGTITGVYNQGLAAKSAPRGILSPMGRTPQPPTSGTAKDYLGLIDAEAKGEYAGKTPNTDFKPYKKPFGQYMVDELGKQQLTAREDAQEYFNYGGPYVVLGGLLKVGEFEIAAVRGGTNEARNVKSTVTSLGTGALFGGAQRAADVGSKSSSASIRTTAKGAGKAIPVVSIALAAPYAVERGWSFGEAYESGRTGEWAGQTAVQLGTFGLGAGVGSAVVAPRTLSVSGKPTSTVQVSAYGKQSYTATGQEVNPPLDVPLVKRTTYTEKSTGALSWLGEVRTRIVEVQGNRYVTRDIGGTPEAPAYRFVSVLKTNAKTTPDGTPIETVLVYKGGKQVRSYEQTAEDFGKITTVSNYNAFKQRTETIRSVEPAAKADTATRTTTDYRTNSNPDKSIVTQRAGREQIVQLRQTVGNKELYGTLGVGTRADAISYTNRAGFNVRRTTIRRTFTEKPTGETSKTTQIGRSEKLLEGTTKVELKVAEEPLRNEFVQSINRVADQQPQQITITGQGATAKEVKGAYAGVVEKPLIETAGQKTVSIAGSIDLRPAAKGAGLRSRISTALGRIMNRADPYVKNPEEIITTPFSMGESTVPAVPAPKPAAKPLPDTPASKRMKELVAAEDAQRRGRLTQGEEKVLSDLTQQTATLELAKLSAPEATDTTFSSPTPKTTGRTIVVQLAAGDRASGQKAGQGNTIIQRAAPGLTIGNTRTIPQVRNDQQASNLSKFGITPIQEARPTQVTTPERVTMPSQVSRPSQVTKPSQVTQPTQVTRPTQVTQQRGNTRLGLGIPTFPEPPKTPTGGSGEDKRGAPVYDLFVRRQGRFFRQNSGGLNLREAFGQGQDIVRNTAAASFQVVERGGQAVDNATLIDRGIFTTSKKDSNIFVQKNKYRISSPGERSEITFKGIQASLTKRKGKRKGGFSW